MERDKVDEHLTAARRSLSKVPANQREYSENNAETELLKTVARIAGRAADFYYSFALTFEKIYQYEYLIQTKGDYSGAVDKMGHARRVISEWPDLAEQLSKAISEFRDLSEGNRNVSYHVEAFKVQKWAYVAFGAEEYARRMEPRLSGFEAYAEAYAADLNGAKSLDSKRFQTAQEEFVSAREKIRQARENLKESESRGRSFFEPRAKAFLDRIPLFEEGFLLHLRASNEFARGNTECAKDLRFKGTTKLRNAFALYPVKDGEAET